MKSEQGIAGTLIKGLRGPGNNSKRPYLHVSFAPCFDKKLESTRRDFAHDFYQKQMNSESGSVDYDDLDKDTDLVLTGEELYQLIKKHANERQGVWNYLNSIDGSGGGLLNRSTDPRQSVFTALSSSVPSSYITNSPNAGSSGFQSDFIFRQACFHLFGFKIGDDEILDWRLVGRRGNNDFVEVKLIDIGGVGSDDNMDDGESSGRKFVLSSSKSADPKDGKVVLSFARAYGFRNIQGIVSKVKTMNSVVKPASLQLSVGEKTDYYDYYHFVEVMACPSGCANGGGIVKGSEVRVEGREMPSVVKRRVENVESFYRGGGGDGVNVDVEMEGGGEINDEEDLSVYYNSVGGTGLQIGGASALQSFHTRFHNVPELKLSQGAVSGVSVENTLW